MVEPVLPAVKQVASAAKVEALAVERPASPGSARLVAQLVALAPAAASKTVRPVRPV